MSLLVMLAVFGSVGAISWAVVNSHAHSEVPVQEKARDAAMVYIGTHHPETAQFISNFAWAGGKILSPAGTEVYVYQSQGWNITVQHPAAANPVYSITADYSVSSRIGDVSVPYRILWQGTWQNGVVTETAYTFAQ
jgi:hypothetical protein